MNWNRGISILITIVAAGVVGSLARRGSAVEPQPARVAATLAAASTGKIGPKQNPLFRGVGSCAASNCHGGDPSSGITGSEYSIWVQKDRHAEAYSILLNKESKAMARKLGLAVEAHKAPLCLNCHSPQRSEPIVEGEKPIGSLMDGVGCESCHGAAKDWLADHIRWTDQTPKEDKLRTGFIDTDDLWHRARMCADCHVGAPGRDVNHDLYAAGHPRLFFEFSAFMANMPIHWDVGEERRHADWTESPGFEAKAWAVGQLATAESALDLLIYRAARSNDQAQTTFNNKYPAGQTLPAWPELAETSCFACHHNLTAPSWRQQRGYSNRKPGEYPWGTWTTPFAGVVTQELLGRPINDDNSGHSLSRLTSLMARPAPLEDDALDEARRLQLFLLEAGRDLSFALDEKQQLSLKQVESLRLAVLKADHSNRNWDEATQVYLALAALQRGNRDLRGLTVSDENDPVLKELFEIRELLEFSADHDSPVERGTDPVTQIDQALSRIRAAVAPDTVGSQE